MIFYQKLIENSDLPKISFFVVDYVFCWSWFLCGILYHVYIVVYNFIFLFYWRHTACWQCLFASWMFIRYCDFNIHLIIYFVLILLYINRILNGLLKRSNMHFEACYILHYIFFFNQFSIEAFEYIMMSNEHVNWCITIWTLQHLSKRSVKKLL